MRAAPLLALALLGCHLQAATGQRCYSSGQYLTASGPEDCADPRAVCDEFFSTCVIPVAQGGACDEWPYATADSRKLTFHQCRILVDAPGGGQRVNAGVCQQRKCVRARRKGETCTPAEGRGPFCRFGVRCEQGRCAGD
jgi:hypothetical protein